MVNRDDVSFAEYALKRLGAGTTQIAGSLASFGQGALGAMGQDIGQESDSLGSSLGTLSQIWNEQGQKWIDETGGTQTFYEGDESLASKWDKGTLSPVDVGRAVSDLALSQAPQFLFGGMAAKGGKAALSPLISRWLPEKAAGFAGAMGGAAIGTGLQETGSIYADQKEKDFGKAAALGFPAGALEAAGFMYGAGKMGIGQYIAGEMAAPTVRTAKQIGLDILKTAGTEGLTEGTQNILEQSGAKKGWNVANDFMQTNWGEVAENAIGGVVMGGIMTGVSAPLTNKVAQIQEEAVRQAEAAGKAKAEADAAVQDNTVADVAEGKQSVSLTGEPTLDELKRATEDQTKLDTIAEIQAETEAVIGETAQVGAAAVIEDHVAQEEELLAQEELASHHPYEQKLASDLGAQNASEAVRVGRESRSIYQGIVEAGGRFIDFSTELVRRFGEAAKRYALQLWNYYKQSPLASERGSFSTKEKVPVSIGAKFKPSLNQSWQQFNDKNEEYYIEAEDVEHARVKSISKSGELFEVELVGNDGSVLGTADASIHDIREKLLMPYEANGSIIERANQELEAGSFNDATLQELRAAYKAAPEQDKPALLELGKKYAGLKQAAPVVSQPVSSAASLGDELLDTIVAEQKEKKAANIKGAGKLRESQQQGSQKSRAEHFVKSRPESERQKYYAWRALQDELDTTFGTNLSEDERQKLFEKRFMEVVGKKEEQIEVAEEGAEDFELDSLFLGEAGFIKRNKLVESDDDIQAEEDKRRESDEKKQRASVGQRSYHDKYGWIRKSEPYNQDAIIQSAKDQMDFNPKLKEGYSEIIAGMLQDVAAQGYSIRNVIRMILKEEGIRTLRKIEGIPDSLDEFTSFTKETQEVEEQSDESMVRFLSKLQELKETGRLTAAEAQESARAIGLFVTKTDKVANFLEDYIAKIPNFLEDRQALANAFIERFNVEISPKVAGWLATVVDKGYLGSKGQLSPEEMQQRFEQEQAKLDEEAKAQPKPYGRNRVSLANPLVGKLINPKDIKGRTVAQTTHEENEAISNSWGAFFEAMYRLANREKNITASVFNLKNLAFELGNLSPEVNYIDVKKRLARPLADKMRMALKMWQESRIEVGQFDTLSNKGEYSVAESIDFLKEEGGMRQQDMGQKFTEEHPSRQKESSAVERVPTTNVTGYRVYTVNFTAENGQTKQYDYLTASEVAELKKKGKVEEVSSKTFEDAPVYVVREVLDSGKLGPRQFMSQITLRRQIYKNNKQARANEGTYQTALKEKYVIVKDVKPKRLMQIFNFLQANDAYKIYDYAMATEDKNGKPFLSEEEFAKIANWELLAKSLKDNKEWEQLKVIDKKIADFNMKLFARLAARQWAQKNVDTSYLAELSISPQYEKLGLGVDELYSMYQLAGENRGTLIAKLNELVEKNKISEMSAKYRLASSQQESLASRKRDIIRAVVTEGFTDAERNAYEAYAETGGMNLKLDSKTQALCAAAYATEQDLLSGKDIFAATNKHEQGIKPEVWDYFEENETNDKFEQSLKDKGITVGTLRNRIAKAFYTAVAKIFGADLVVVYDKKYRSRYIAKANDGKSKVVINLAEGKTKFARIFAHEIFHHIVNKAAPKEYAAFKKAVFSVIRNEQIHSLYDETTGEAHDLPESRLSKEQRVASFNRIVSSIMLRDQVSREVAEEEVLSEMFASVATNKKFYEALAETILGRSLAARIVSGFVRTATKMNNVLHEDSNFVYENTILLNDFAYSEVYDLVADLVGQSFNSRGLQHASERFYTQTQAQPIHDEIKGILAAPASWLGGFWDKIFPKGAKSRKEIMTHIEGLLKNIVEWLKLGTKHIFAHFGADPAQADLAYKIAYSHAFEVARMNKLIESKWKHTFKGWGNDKLEKLHDDFTKGQFEHNSNGKPKKVGEAFDVTTEAGKQRAKAAGYSDEVISLFAFYQEESKKIYERLSKVYPDLNYTNTHYGQSIQWYSEKGTLLDKNFDWPVGDEQSKLEGNKRYLKERAEELSTRSIREGWKYIDGKLVKTKGGMSYKTINPHELMTNYATDSLKLVALKDAMEEAKGKLGKNGKPIAKVFASPQEAAAHGYYPVDDNALKIFSKIVKEEAEPEATSNYTVFVTKQNRDGETYRQYIKDETGFIRKFKDEEAAKRALEILVSKGYEGYEYEEEMVMPQGATVAQVYMQKDLAQMINVLLAPDWIRHGSFMGITGRGVMKLKNLQTTMEFALSSFHALTIGQELISSTAAWAAKRYQGTDRAIEMARGFNPLSSGVDSLKIVKLLEEVHLDEKKANDPRIIKQLEELLGTKDVKILDILGAYYAVGGELHQDKSLHSPMHAWGDMKYIDKSVKGKLGQLASMPRMVSSSIKGVYDDSVAADGKRLTAAGKAALFGTLQATTSWLMDYGIPRIKMAAFMREYTLALDVNKAKLAAGTVTKEQLARDVMWFIEDRFGEVNWQNKWMKPSVKTILQFLFRSFTWFTGSWTAFGKAGLDVGKWIWFKGKGQEKYELTQQGRWAFAAVFAHMMTAGALWTAYAALAGDDEVPQEEDLAGATLENALFPRVDPFDPTARVTIPSYVTELYKILRHVGAIGSEAEYAKLVTGRFNSLIGRGYEALWTGEDWRGVSITDSDDTLPTRMFKNALHVTATMPISISTIARSAREKGLSAQGIAMGLGGFTDAPAAAKRTEATTKAFAVRRDIYKGQKVEQEKMEAKDDLKRAMYKMSQGDSSELKQMMAEGKVSQETYERELKKLPRINGKKNPLFKDQLSQALGQGMTMEGALEVWPHMTDNEKNKHRGEIKKKYLNMMARKDKSPADKQKIRQQMIELGIMR